MYQHPYFREQLLKEHIKDLQCEVARDRMVTYLKQLRQKVAWADRLSLPNRLRLHLGDRLIVYGLRVSASARRVLQRS